MEVKILILMFEAVVVITETEAEWATGRVLV
jgi:hypothetical protein